MERVYRTCYDIMRNNAQEKIACDLGHEFLFRPDDGPNFSSTTANTWQNTLVMKIRPFHEYQLCCGLTYINVRLLRAFSCPKN